MRASKLRSRRGRLAPRIATFGSKKNSVSMMLAAPPSGRRWTFRAALLASAAGAILAPSAASALDSSALPTNGQVASGTAAINQSGSAMTVTQSSQKAIINWQTFNIGSQASVNFQQPGASSIALNRVPVGSPSEIDGHLTATGQIFLINPSGITFGAGAQVNVGGLVASTMGISDKDFNAGTYTFKRHGSTGTILNQGTVTTADGGYIGFLAPNIINQGNLVTGRFGSVVLAAGSKVTLSLDSTGTSLVSAQVDPTKVQTLIENHSLIAAPDGRVIMSAQAASALMGSTINNSGIIEADSLTSDGGVVTLEASSVTNTGTISASGATQSGSGNGGTIRLVSADTTTVSGSLIARGGVDGGNGGLIETSGHDVVYGGAFIDTRAPHGKTGNWLLDPYDFTITNGGTSGDNTISNTDLDNELLSSNVTLSTQGSAGDGNGNGDIFVNGAVYWYAPTSLTLNAFRDIDVNANITHVGGGGGLALNPNTGGAGGSLNIADGSSVSLSSGDTFSMSGTQYTLITTTAQLQAVANNLGGDYALANDLDMTGLTFAPLGSNSSAFDGIFEGLGHSIGNLTINAPTSSYVGLFGANAGLINDIHLSNEQVTGFAYVGGLAGVNYGMIANSSVQGTIAGGSGASAFNIGGLVGCNCAPQSSTGTAGTILGSFALTTVTAGDGVNSVGGFAGSNQGSIASSFTIGSVSTGTRSVEIGGFVGANGAGSSAAAPSEISGSFAQDTVTVGSNGINIGGFVGFNVGVVGGGSYARGTVVAGDGSSSVGGFAGANSTSATGTGGIIDSASAVETVTVGNDALQVGGLVGYNAGIVTNSFSAGSVAAGDDSSAIGGLAGYNDGVNGAGTISGSYSLMSVSSGTASTNVGGLVGHNSGLISADFTSGMTVTAGNSSSAVGGIAGLNDTTGIVDHTYDYGNNNLVSVGTGSTEIGGLAGINNGIIRNGSYSTGTVTAGSGSSMLGGLVGANNTGGTIDDSWGVGTVSGAAASVVGGLAGLNSGTISNSYSSITVGGADETVVGGLVGNNLGGFITASYALGTVIGSTEVGGLVGRNGAPNKATTGGTISGSYSQTTVTGTSNVGGLVGTNYYNGLITGSHTFGGQVVASDGATNIGGLVGYTIGNIDNSYNSANIQAGNSVQNVGGLVGLIDAFANGGVTSSYSSGSVVTGTGSSNVGGLVGQSNNIMLFSYNTGSVSAGAGSSNVGGLAGAMNGGGNGLGGLVDTSNSTGNVTVGTSSQAIGGLVGLSNAGTVLDGWASSTVTAGDNSSNIGGLVGANANGIVNGGNSFGQVTGGNGVQNVGGLIGLMSGSGSQIQNNSTANSNVTVGTTSNAIGSLIGQLQGGGTVVSGTGNGTVTAGAGSTNVGGQIGETSP